MHPGHLKGAGHRCTTIPGWSMTQGEFEERIARFSFDLPDDLIARHPTASRDHSRLLVVETDSGRFYESRFSDLPSLVKAEDHLIFNRTRVSFRRLVMHDDRDRKFEPLFVKRTGALWKTLVFKAAKLREGSQLRTSEAEIFTVAGRENEFVLLRPEKSRTDDEWEQFFEQNGKPPLPPYISRDSTDEDRLRYRTVFGTQPGSLAAPTAGLHFTEKMMEDLRTSGFAISHINLAIGLGTFSPLKPWNFEQKVLHNEQYTIPEETVEKLKKPLRRLAVGTTTLRALESNLRQFGEFRAGSFSTNLFVFPPQQITAVQGLVTNFHLPGSSLFMLVCAFAGTEIMKRAYDFAITRKFRFFSYGDAMLVVSRI